jgi:hypothetical protein
MTAQDGPGDYLYGDGGEVIYVCDTAQEALAFFEEEMGERPEWVHSEVLRARVVYAADVEAGECHEDAEPGDTTYDYVTRERRPLRELGENEVRVWIRGPWTPGWMIDSPHWTGRPGHTVTVDGVEVGEYETAAAAERARKEAVENAVRQWKAAQMIASDNKRGPDA